MNRKFHSKETREKISISNKGKHSRKFTEDHKKKIGNALKGKPKSDEAKKRMSESGKKKIFSESHRLHISESVSGIKNGFYGKTHSDEVRKIISNIHKGKKISEEHKKIISNFMKQRKLSDRHIRIIRERMLNGGASYANLFIKNPSKPQVKLYELVLTLFPKSILNFPIEEINRCIDIAIPEYMLAIEYDGSYWHKNKKEDKERQREIENLGWKFIRYVDYIPSIEELKTEIEKLKGE